MKNQLTIILLLVFGFFFLPEKAQACNAHAVQATGMAYSVGKQCDNATGYLLTSHKDNKSGCGCCGNCQSSSCHCSQYRIFSSLQTDTIFGILIFTDKKKNIGYCCYISGGYLSVWLPPKIG